MGAEEEGSDGGRKEGDGKRLKTCNTQDGFSGFPPMLSLSLPRKPWLSPLSPLFFCDSSDYSFLLFSMSGLDFWRLCASLLYLYLPNISEKVLSQMRFFFHDLIFF